MNVTLRLISHDPIDSGRYLILRGSDRFAWPGGPLVLSAFRGWEVVARGETHKWFRLISEARSWLNSGDGQRWLDGLPKETP
jgi:hypothetical protein